MGNDVAFKFMKIVVIREASKRKGVAQLGSESKETVGVEVAVAFSYCNSKTVEPGVKFHA